MSTSYDKKALRTTSLIAYWPMNEESGTVVYDMGPNGYNGVSAGLIRVPSTSGLSGFLGPDGSRCALFQSASSEINLIAAAPSSSTVKSWGKGSQTTGSIAVWVAIPQANLKGTTRMDVCRFAADDSNEIEIYFDTAAYRFAMLFKGGTTGVTNNTSLAYNIDGGTQNPQWHHLCMTYDTDAMLTYLDGKVETDTADTTSSAWSGNYASNLMNVGITSQTATTSDFFNGYMKGFLWSGAVLSAAEVKELSIAGP